MSVTTGTIYDVMVNDSVLGSLLATYNNKPAIFTTDPPPGNATLPYVVTSGESTQAPFDTKTVFGRSVSRDIRCYDDLTGSIVVVEAIAERVRALFHRQELTISGFKWLISDVIGPVAIDEDDAYGRLITLNLIIQETE